VSLEVRPARDEDEVAAALRLRHEVFVEEQSVPLADELDGRDDEALHVVAIYEAGTVVGTLRLLDEGESMRLGRLAVCRQARRRGVGRALLREAERLAGAAGAARIDLAAQTTALALYESEGYVARGPAFLDAGIEHVAMERVLA
jgi:predicted GNAT family N-acyltransferase